MAMLTQPPPGAGDAASVYILRCADGRYYVGSTRGSVETRVSEHNLGRYDGFTARHRPVELVFSRGFPRIVDAIIAERQLKGWSRAKKEALIRGDVDALKTLASRAAR